MNWHFHESEIMDTVTTQNFTFQIKTVQDEVWKEVFLFSFVINDCFESWTPTSLMSHCDQEGAQFWCLTWHMFISVGRKLGVIIIDTTRSMWVKWRKRQFSPKRSKKKKDKTNIHYKYLKNIIFMPHFFLLHKPLPKILWTKHRSAYLILKKTVLLLHNQFVYCAWSPLLPFQQWLK